MRASVLESLAWWTGLLTVTVLWSLTLAWLYFKLAGEPAQ